MYITQNHVCFRSLALEPVAPVDDSLASPQYSVRRVVVSFRDIVGMERKPLVLAKQERRDSNSGSLLTRISDMITSTPEAVVIHTKQTAHHFVPQPRQTAHILRLLERVRLPTSLIQFYSPGLLGFFEDIELRSFM